MKKELLTVRLRLVPVASQDCDLLATLLRKPAIKRYLCDNQDIEKESVHRMISNSDALFEEKGVGLWLIREAAGGSAIGFCGFLQEAVLELIYVVHPDSQNRGLATESVLRIIEHFRQLKFTDALFAKVDVPNIASHAVTRKIGMKPAGIEKNRVTGGDMQVYELP